MKALLAVCAVVVVSAVAGGCDKLFYDDFNADAVGALPNASPAGSPAGDRVGFFDASVPGQFVVADSPEMGSKVLRLHNVSVPPYTRRYIGFYSRDGVFTERYFRATWTGRSRLKVHSSALAVRLGDSDNDKYFMQMALVGNSIDVTWPTLKIVGDTPPNEKQTITITIDRSNAKFRVEAMPGELDSGWLPVVSGSPLGTTQPTLYFEFLNGSGGEAHQSDTESEYDIDEVEIAAFGERWIRPVDRAPVQYP